MANQVPPIKLNLKLEGLEGLEKLKGSFRELSKVTNLSDKDIGKVRDSLFEFAKKAGDTERANKGLTEAIKGLLGEAQKGGLVWQQLNSDLTKLQQQSRLTDSQINTLRESIVYEANTHKQSAASIREHIKSLQDLRSQAVLGGQVAQKLSENIQTLSQKMQEGEGANRDHFKSLNQILAVKPDAVLRQWRAYTEVLSDARATAEQAATAQERLNRLAGAPRIAARRAIGARAEIQADPEYLKRFGIDGRSLEEMPNITAAFSQRLKELQEDLSFTERNTEIYIATSLKMLGVQRELTGATQGLGAALVQQLKSGDLVPSQKNLQEVIGQLRREMLELDTTTTEGARAYAENANQARVLENQLKELAGAYRNVADMATQAATAQTSEATARVTANYLNRGMVRAQEQALAELGQRVRAGVAATPLALPAAGQTTAPGTGLEISGGARVGRATGRIQQAVMRPVFGEDIGGTGLTEAEADRARRAAISERDAIRDAGEARARAEQQIQSYRAEIDKARRADIGSIESTERLRGAINQYRSTLPGASAEFRKLTKELGDLDVRSEKLSRSLGRRRMTGMQMTQAAGAALSGGIFGGPEGFLGGAIGSAFGVGGAFAGAAIGAQVGGLRQQLGGFADYAAQIQKMQIALENAAGSQSEFNRAMAAAASATQNLNVPQDVAIQGMTRLTAAVKGAGGQVSDAEIVFNNVTSAIKATGGSAQDVDGAITAMVQVFSKGKVSAEELSGQLGERLPGAVTKFAQANEMTLPELQKALEQGQVGLNELMNFIVQLGDEYSGVAGQIAASSQDSGARLLVAFNDMKIAVGEALQPIGAQFQEAFIPFIENITPVLVDILPKIGDAALAVAKNFDTLAIAAAAALGVFAVGKIAAIGGVGAALLKLAAAAGTATASFQALNAAALLNPWTALAAGVAAVGVAFYDAHKEKQRFDEVMRSGTADELAAEIERLEQKIRDASSKTASYSSDIRGVGNEAGYASIEIRNMRAELENIKGEYKVRLLFEQAGLDPEKGFYTPVGKTKPKPSVFPSLTEDNKGSGKTKKERESQLPQLMAQLAMQQQIAQINEKIRNAQLAENQFLQVRLEGERELAQIAGEIRAIAFEKIPADEAEVKRKLLILKADEARRDIALKLQQLEKQNLVEITQQSGDLAKSYTTQIEDRQRLQELVATGMKEALALEYIQIENILEKEKERLEIRKALLEQAGDVTGALSTQDLIDRLGSKETGLKELAAAAQPEEKGKLQQFIEQAEAELRDLEAVAVEISQNMGNAIGNSIANGLTGLIEGTTTAKQIFADFLKDVGQILIQQGAKMIATYIAIGIARVFAGFASASSASSATPGALGQATNTGLDTGAGNISDMLSGLAAKGAYFSGGQSNFAQNSIQPFAMGGIVTRPTFFKYAKGGEMQNGLMGEAGPEAIMPLRRTADGRLGVEAIGLREAMDRGPGYGGGYGRSSGGTVDVRYSIERINNVDYVTAEQFERGMTQAAQQGAVQGERRALRTLGNSPATRRRLGV